MADAAETLRIDGANVHFRVLPPRSVLRLTSFLPEVKRGEQCVNWNAEELPRSVGTTSELGMRILILGPAEWWLISDEPPADILEALSTSDRESQGLVISDLSSGLSVLEVSGAGARPLLTRGCGLDLYPTVFPPGSCARTRFAQIPLVIDFVQAPDRFELYVARSLAAYLNDWLNDAMGVHDKTV